VQRVVTRPDHFLDTRAVDEATAVTDLAIEEFLDGSTSPRGTVISAPAVGGVDPGNLLIILEF
jgi:hypothetical protein